MKKEWSIPDGDNPVIVIGLSVLLVVSWVLVLFSFPLTVGYTDGTVKTFGYKGWGDKLFARITKVFAVDWKK